MTERLENFELRYLGYVAEKSPDATIYTFSFRLTPMIIAGTMLGDANFKDVSVKVRMPLAIVRKWGLGSTEAATAFTFAFCDGIGLDLDSDYVDVGEWASEGKCPLRAEPLPNPGETWTFACSKAISYFPFLPQSPSTPSHVQREPKQVDRPLGKASLAILIVLGLCAAGVVSIVVEKVVGTNAEGATTITFLLIVVAFVGYQLSKSNTENWTLKQDIEDLKRKRPPAS